MDRNVTSLERAFQLAKSGEVSNLHDIRKTLKQEGFDANVVQDGPSLKTQLRNLIKAAQVSSAGVVALGPSPTRGSFLKLAGVAPVTRASFESCARRSCSVQIVKLRFETIRSVWARASRDFARRHMLPHCPLLYNPCCSLQNYGSALLRRRRACQHSSPLEHP